jgi:hypothetical protein
LCHLRSALNHHVEAGSTIATPGCIRPVVPAPRGPRFWRAVIRPSPTTLTWGGRDAARGARPWHMKSNRPEPLEGYASPRNGPTRRGASSQGCVNPPRSGGGSGKRRVCQALPWRAGEGRHSRVPGQAAGGGRLRRGERGRYRPATGRHRPHSLQGYAHSDPRVHWRAVGLTVWSSSTTCPTTWPSSRITRSAAAGGRERRWSGTARDCSRA